MTEAMKLKRATLKELSSSAAILVKTGAFDTINKALVAMYAEQGHTEIHSFKQWLAFGKVVKKGEKALLLWGEPVNGNKQETEATTEDDENKFFPLAYVFSNLQVEPLKKAA